MCILVYNLYFCILLYSLYCAALVMNLAKTKEIVFHHPNPRDCVYLITVDTIDQLTVAEVLGVVVHSGFECDNHDDFVLKEFIG